MHILLVDLCCQRSHNAYQDRCMRVHVVMPGQRLSHASAKTEFLVFPNWNQPGKEDESDALQDF